MKRVLFIYCCYLLSGGYLYSQVQIGQTILGTVGKYFPEAIDISDDGTRLIAVDEEIDGFVVYDLQDSVWILSEQIDINHPFLGDTKISLSGDGNVVVKEYRDWLITFIWDGNTWQKMDLNIRTPEYKYITDMDLSYQGDVLGVHYSYGMLSEYVFYHRDNNTWESLGNKIIVGEKTYNSYDNQLELSSDGKTAILGCVECELNNLRRGTAYVYHFDGQNWNRKGNILSDPSTTRYGREVDISSDANVIMISSQNGLVVHTWNGTEWQQKGDMPPINWGHDFKMDGTGNRIAYSKPNFTDDPRSSQVSKGALFVLEYFNNYWSHIGRPIIGKTPEMYFGKNVAMAKNGKTVIAGGGVYDEPGILEAYLYDGFYFRPTTYISSKFDTCDYSRIANITNLEIIDITGIPYKYLINSRGRIFLNQTDSIQINYFPMAHFQPTPSSAYFSEKDIRENLAQGTFHDTICLLPTEFPTNDLKIDIIVMGNARPGRSVLVKLIYSNIGTTIRNGSIDLYFDKDFQKMISTSPSYINNGSNGLSWTYNELWPLETREIVIELALNRPTDSPPLNGGEKLLYSAKIEPVADDVDASNNLVEADITVVNSQDPNDKTCMQGDTISHESIGKRLTYVIRFENVGSAEAIDISIQDIIDTSCLDISTFELVDASHTPSIRISNGNIIDFTFKDINLPFEEDTNDGYVAFSMKSKKGVNIGEQIKNKASIYFDFNYPIITNEAITTVTDRSTSVSQYLNNLTVTVYPNPATSYTTISAEEPIEFLSVYTLDGKLIKQEVYLNGGEKIQELKLSDLPAGAYLITVMGTENIGTVKVNKY